jgi:4-hydroxy-4-methyl-2-oxoglutarate aldolase
LAIVLNPSPAPLPSDLLKKLGRVSPPTIGHFLEEGFCSPEIRTMTPGKAFVGRAITVRVPAPDGLLMHIAASRMETGDVMVVDTGGNRTHAFVGAVIATAAQASGACGVVVDGLVTDVVELREMGLPVHARGTSALTAKQLGLDDGGVNIPVVCGGTQVRPGDVVLADENGVLALPPDVAAGVVDQALDSDSAEPELLHALRAGQPLPEVSGAAEQLRKLGYPAW